MIRARAVSPEPHPRRLPLSCLSIGHAVLLAALLATAIAPAPLATSFLHPHTLAFVHALTLGPITLSIVGATWIVGPLALGMPMRATRVDGAACALLVLGATGVVAHFWLNGYSGIAWSGAVIALGAAMLGVRVLTALRASRAPRVIATAIASAYGNLLLAAVLGVVVAADRDHAFLQGGHFGALVAHAHLAAVGWAALMFIGVGYRLLPMFLPAAPPRGLVPWFSVLAIQIGLLGLVATRLTGAPGSRVCALLVAAGLVAFLIAVAGMLRQRRPPPRALRRPDPGMLQAMKAIAYLVLAIALGSWLSWRDDVHPGWIAVYGVCGLLGFLVQAVLGVAQRLLPLFAWSAAWHAGGRRELPPSPHAMPVRALQWLSFGLWNTGLPLLAAGAGLHRAALVSAGAWVLLAGAACAIANAVCVVRAGDPRSRMPST